MLKRILSAAVALLIFIPALLYGKWLFSLLVFLMATIGYFELLRMKGIMDKIPIVFSFIFVWFFLYPASTFHIKSLTFTKLNLLLIFIIILLMYTVFSKNRFTFDHAGFMLLSALYVGFGFQLLITTRSLGLAYILFILFAIWATDTGAYFTGNALGKHKLWPAISPNKTIEGALGGIVSAIVVGAIFQSIVPLDIPFFKAIMLVTLISIFGQIGDLVASAFKRYFNVKDSGYIMPGHGGILDRMDSLIFVMLILSAIQFL